MGRSIEVERWLRRRVLGLLHAGRIGPGDRLPSIRQIAQEQNIDHRAVAGAYRALEREGLVQIRRGAGVYVAEREESPEGVLPETARWIAGILLDGWEHRLSRSEMGDLMNRCTSPLRCACLESNEDHMVALCAELEEDFSLEPARVQIAPEAAAEDVALESLGDADLVVTTVFHANLARDLAARTAKPIVVVTFHPEFTAEIDRRLREGPITAVFVDPRFADRAKSYFAVTQHRERVRFVPVDRVGDEEIDLASEDVMVTRAARRRLGMEDFHLLPPPPPVISAESAGELYNVIARLTLQTA